MRMAKSCGWCGEKIGFTDMAYDGVDTGTKWHWVCGKCCGQIAQAKKGYATIEGIKTSKTAPDLFNYYSKKEEKKSDEVIQKEKLMREQQRIKEESQQTNPLYDDIHQIAGDLRFIKNYLIFTIIVGIILGLVVACSSM